MKNTFLESFASTWQKYSQVCLSLSLSLFNYSLDTVEKHKMGRQWKRD